MAHFVKRLAAFVICLCAAAALSPARAAIITYQFDSVRAYAPVGLYNTYIPVTVVGHFTIDTLTSQVLPVDADLLLDGNSQRPYGFLYTDATDTLRIIGDQSITDLVFGASLFNGVTNGVSMLVIGNTVGLNLTGSVSVTNIVDVPEPASLLLLGVGAGAMVRVRRRTRLG